jgi:hypothetical protein
MCCGNEEHSGIMANMSRRAGTCVGKVAAAGKKITGVVTSGATAIGNLPARLVNTPEPIAAEQNEPISEDFDIETREQQAEQEESAKSLISALESDLAEAISQLKEAQSNAEKTQSQIASQLRKLQSEKESLLAELEQARSQANEAKPQPPFEMSPAQTEQESGLPMPVEEVVVGAAREKSGSSAGTAVIEEQLSQVASNVEMPAPPAVTDEEIQAAVFSKVTDKILFAKALSDMANQDVAVRLDAVKRITDIGHELSLKALVAQMALERSPQVRQECIKALTTLGMKEGLPAIENALADKSGLVRLAAVWGLYRLAGKQSGTALAGMLSDKDEGVRRRAATCIGWLGQGKLAADLTILLDDDSALVRQSAAEAMGNLGNERVVLSMIEHLKDPDKTTRKTILCAIEKITGKKMGKSLPTTEENIGRLIARWRQWWKEDMLK